MRACAHLCKLVFIDLTLRSLGTIKGLSAGSLQRDMPFGAVAMGGLVEMGGSAWGGRGGAVAGRPTSRSLELFVKEFRELL